MHRQRRAGGHVVSALFFFPRGGSAQVARSLCRALPESGWTTTLVAGSLGDQGEPTHAPTFFAGLDTRAVDYSPAARLDDPLTGRVPFQPSYEDRPGAPDRVFAAVARRVTDVYEQALVVHGAPRPDGASEEGP